MHSMLLVGMSVFGMLQLSNGYSNGDVDLSKIVHFESMGERDTRMAWWEEARFGMFVHWGLYSIAGGEWDGKEYPPPYLAEWIQKYAGVPAADYEKTLVPQFRPAPGFADQWAALAEDAGAKYVVFTAKHHDGFSMHGSAETEFDALDITGRDLVKEITDAIRSRDLGVGVFYSLWDWHHPDAPAGEGAVNLKGLSMQGRTLSRYVDYFHSQVNELTDGRYGDIDVLWLDYSRPGYEGEVWGAQRLVPMVRNNQPDIIINNRLWLNRRRPDEEYEKYWFGDFSTPEQYVPSTGMGAIDWEVCDTLNGSWGWSRCAQEYKTVDELLRRMAGTVSRGGNYLLNIGPLPDGTVDPESERLMRGIGEWMDINGEAVYGTEAGPFVRLPWGYATLKEVQEGWKLYLYVFDWPSDGILHVPGLETQPLNVGMLGDDARTIRCSGVDGKVVVSGLPENPPHPSAGVVMLGFNERPSVAPHRVHARKDGTFELRPGDAVVESRLNLRGRSHLQPEKLEHWRTGSRARFPLFLEGKGTYTVHVTAATRKFDERNEYYLKAGDREVPLELAETGGLGQRRVFRAGPIVLPAGKTDLTLGCGLQSRLSDLNIFTVELKPETTMHGEPDAQ